MQNVLRSVLVALALSPMVGAPVLEAQEAFEIEVYPYATANRGEWELEAHLNYSQRGTTVFDGAVAPTQHQARFAAELTRGITAHWEVAGYLLAARRPDVGIEYAGWRLRSRVRAPETWRLPVNVGLSIEYEGTRAAFSESRRTLEITPIFERSFGALRLTVDPAFERDLGGETEDRGWEFEPRARGAVGVSRVVTLGLEYFGALGEVGEFLPAGRQVHQFYPSVDLRLGPEFTVNAGVGFGATNAGDRLVFKTRVEIPM